ncbi:DUF167 family protein YggU [Ferrimonas senticii]|uniref:DUF167 family protein YggU n=1 Tax=Ferrimonas senticii TaxID=394566 RepID=UPI00040D331B|nr:DUF167 family protein YggU [Ferrimonas senticii]
MSAIAVQQQGNDLLLNLYIQPKASRDALVGLHGDELKVAITAPPVDGKANAHLTKYLAKQFKVAKGQVAIVKGELGRHKQIRIIEPKQLPPEIAALL